MPIRLDNRSADFSTRFAAFLATKREVAEDVEQAVRAIIADVRQNGDRALAELTKKFDRVDLNRIGLRVTDAELKAAGAACDARALEALALARDRIEAYHRRQKPSDERFTDPLGVELGHRWSAIEAVGLYVPGGTAAYPSSVLMNAIPARVAGVPALTVVTPPRALEQSPALAAALLVAGVEGSVFRVGGAQAVAALAYGTARIGAVAKIVGPGNAFVAEAKRQVRGAVEIDQEAGPSEVVILADDSADAGWVAADLLAQAEHGSGEETVVLVTTSAALAEEAVRLVAEGLPSIANRRAAARALGVNGAAVVVADLAEGIALVNALAAEHVEVQCRRAAAIARRIVAGAVFVGPWAPVAVGDYGIGPNHVLPTGGSARRASALSVADFQRRHSRVRMTEQGLRRVAGDVVTVARAEGFPGHAQSVLTRFAR